MWKKFWIKGRSSILKNQLAKKVTGIFGLKILFTGLSFLISLLLARLLGVEEYGVYTYAMTWITLLQIPASLGLRDILICQVSAYQARSQLGMMRGLLLWSNLTVFLVSIGIILIATIVAWILKSEVHEQFLPVFWLALPIIPLSALSDLRRGAMLGLHQVVRGEIPGMLVYPVLLLILQATAYLLSPDGLNAPLAMGIRVLTLAVSFIYSIHLLRESLPRNFGKVRPNYQICLWTRSIIPFLFIGCTYYLNSNTDILMLGAIKGPEEVGIYFVATRGAELIGFILLAVNITLGSVFTKLYTEGDFQQLQRILTKTTNIVFLFSLPISLCLIAGGHWFLLLFGAEFTRGHIALAVLGIGQLVNAAAGPIALLLSMTGYEKYTAICVGMSAIANIILNALLIEPFGLSGATIATTSSMILLNILLAMFVYKKMKLSPTIFGHLFVQKSNY
ncbi:MAG: flippase [Pleurocapsa sp.]